MVKRAMVRKERRRKKGKGKGDGSGAGTQAGTGDKTKNKLCFHFKNGNCRHDSGKECLFSHNRDLLPDGHPLKPKGGGKGKDKGKGKGRGGRGKGRGGSRQRANSAPATVTAAPAPNTKKTVCRNFAKGHCDKGDGCAFSHSAKLVAAKKTPCNQHVLGLCSRGKECRFSHNQELCAAAKPKPKKPKPKKAVACRARRVSGPSASSSGGLAAAAGADSGASSDTSGMPHLDDGSTDSCDEKDRHGNPNPAYRRRHVPMTCVTCEDAQEDSSDEEPPMARNFEAFKLFADQVFARTGSLFSCNSTAAAPCNDEDSEIDSDNPFHGHVAHHRDKPRRRKPPETGASSAARGSTDVPPIRLAA